MSGDEEIRQRYLKHAGIIDFLNENGSKEGVTKKTVLSIEPIESAEGRRNPLLGLVKDMLCSEDHALYKVLAEERSQLGHNETKRVGHLYVETGNYPMWGDEPRSYDFIELELDALVLPFGMTLPKFNTKVMAHRLDEDWGIVNVKRRDHVKRLWLPGWRRKTLNDLLPDKIFLPKEFEECPDNYKIDRGPLPNFI